MSSASRISLSSTRQGLRVTPTSGWELRALRFDELDLVAVGVFDEGDDRGAALDRAGLASDLAAAAAYAVAGLRDVGNADRDVAIGAAEVVALDAVVVGELEHGGAALGGGADQRAGRIR